MRLIFSNPWVSRRVSENKISTDFDLQTTLPAIAECIPMVVDNEFGVKRSDHSSLLFYVSPTINYVARIGHGMKAVLQ